MHYVFGHVKIISTHATSLEYYVYVFFLFPFPHPYILKKLHMYCCIGKFPLVEKKGCFVLYVIAAIADE